MSEKNLGWEEEIFFKCFAFSRKTFAFPRETFAFSRKDICILSQNFCVLSQNQLISECLLYSLQWFIQLRMFTMERFIEFYFELGQV